MGADTTDRVSFVLRLWLESPGMEDPRWRYQVHHVQTGRERYCRGLEDVLEFIEESAEVAPPALAGRTKSGPA